MPRVQWPLQLDRPAIQVVLTLMVGGQKLPRTLLADTGAGNMRAPFDLVLDESDCVICGRFASQMMPLGGAYTGVFPLYLVRVEMPALAFLGRVLAVGVPNLPKGFGGFACFRFLNRFTYGNFGDSAAFGLES